MASRIYATFFTTVTIAAVQDVFNIKAGAANGIELHHIMLTAGGVTAAAEIRLRLKRQAATVTQGSGGSTPTMSPIDSGDTKAATAVVHANDTTPGTSSGTTFGLLEWQWNVLGPFEHLPNPEDREVCQAAEALILDIVTTTPASTVVSGYIKWREIP